MASTALPELRPRAGVRAWIVGCLVGVVAVFAAQWCWGIPLTNDGPAHLFSAYVYNHYADGALGFADHFELRNPVTGNGWRLIAWMEPALGWRLAYRLWYVLATELAFLSAYGLWLAQAHTSNTTTSRATSRATPWLALAISLPLAFPMGVYLGTVAYVLGAALALGGLGMLLVSRTSRGFVGISALWLASAWLHPVPVAIAGLMGGLGVLAGDEKARRLCALAIASVPAVALLAAYVGAGGEPQGVTENHFAPLLERTVLLMSRLLPTHPAVSAALLGLAVGGLATGLRQPRGTSRGLAVGASGLLLVSMLLPEHAMGWQLISGRLLPLGAPIAFALLVLMPARAQRWLLVPATAAAVATFTATVHRHRALNRASEEALAGIDEIEPARLQLVEIITRPFGTYEQDLDAVPAGVEPMAKLSSIWAVAAGGRPMFTFANPRFPVHPLKLKADEPRSPFDLKDADQVRDEWPARADDLRRLASSAASLGGLFAFGEPDDARVYDEAGFVRLGGRGAVYLGRFDGCRGRVRLRSESPRVVEVSVGWWPRRRPQYAPMRLSIGAGSTEIDPGLLGCGEVWASVAPGRCAEGTPARAQFGTGNSNVIDCTIVDAL